MRRLNNFPDEPGRDQPVVFQKRSSSERRDRTFVHRALRRGVSTQEIEGRLLATTEFHRLNPECDSIAYVRGLIDEESSGLISLELDKQLIGDSSPNSSNLLDPAFNQHAMHAEAEDRRYIQENFEPQDWLAVVVRNRQTDETVQRITTAHQIASDEFQSWLRHKNAHGSDIYLSLNTLKEHSHGRTKGDVKEIRHLYLDLDEGGQLKLEAIYENPSVPHPNYVLQTSPDKYQVIWRVEGLPQKEAEELLRSLAKQFGGDPAATDSTRVFRLPGFNNKKYDHDFTVKLAPGTLPEPVYHRSDFKIDSLSHEYQFTDRAAAPAQSAVHPQSPSTQSERDWAYALRHLRQGDTPEKIIREIAFFRSTDRYETGYSKKPSAPRKANPRYYAEHTVARALEHLGRTNQAQEQTRDQGESRLPEAEPNR